MAKQNSFLDQMRSLVRQDLQGVDLSMDSWLRDLVKKDLRSSGYEILGELPAEKPPPPEPPFDPMYGWKPPSVLKVPPKIIEKPVPSPPPIGAPSLVPSPLTRKAPEITRELKPTYGPEPGLPEGVLRPEKRPPLPSDVEDWTPPPGWFQQVYDIARLLSRGDLSTHALVARGLLRGLAGKAVDPVKLIEKISGQEGFTEEYNKLEREALQKKVAYTPTIGMKLTQEAAELAGILVPLSKVFKGAGIAAKAATKIPILQRIARAEIVGAATGLAREPEEPGFINKLKQIPGDITFFTAIDAGLLTFGQALKILKWNRAFKHHKGVKWGSWEDIPEVPGRQYTAEEMKRLFVKMRMNSAGGATVPEGLTPDELKILEHFKTKGGWNQAVKEGWLNPEFQPSAAAYAEVGPLPRKPQWGDIFRRGPLPPFEKPVEAARRPFPREEAPPIRPEPEVPGEPPPVRPSAAPAVVVDVNPNAQGGWTYDFKIPTEPIPPRPAAVPRLAPGEGRKLLPARVVETIDKKADDILDRILTGRRPTVPKAPPTPPPSMRPLMNRLKKRPIDIDDIEEQGMLGEFEEILELQRAGKIPRIIVGKKSRLPKQKLYTAIENAQQDGMIPEAELDPFKDAIMGEYAGAPAIPPEERFRFDKAFEADVKKMTDDYYDDLAAQFEDDLRLFDDQELEGTLRGTEIETEILRKAEDDIARGIFDLERGLEATVARVEPFTKDPQYKKWREDVAGLKKEIMGKEENLPVLEKLATRAHDMGIPVGMLPRELTEEYFDRLEGIPPIKKFELKREAEKERWQMNRTEYEDIKAADELPHKEMITRALREGKAVPDEVLDEYPTLRRMKPRPLVEKPELVPRKEVKPTVTKPRVPEFIEREPKQLKLDEELTEKLKFEEPERAAWRYTDEELLDIFKKYEVPREFQTDVGMALQTKYAPEKGPVENYVRRILSRLTKKEIVKATAAKVEPLKKEIPTKERGPFDRFASAEEEVRVLKVFKRVAKNAREEDILKRRILDNEPYASIGRRHNIKPQSAEKAFKKALEKVKADPEVVDMIKKRIRYMGAGPAPTTEDIKEMLRRMAKWTTSRKGMVEHIDAMNDRRIGFKLAEQFEASLDAKDLDKFIRKNRTEGLENFIFRILKGEVDPETTALPEEAKGLLSRMRDRVDILSQLIIANGGVSDTTKQVFERNLGKYLARKFRIYEQKPRGMFQRRRWNPPPEARTEFSDYLKSAYPRTFGNFSEEEMDNFLDAMLRKRDYFYQPPGRTGKRIPTDIFKRRKDLPDAYLKFAGVIEDPVWVYLYTVTKQAQAAFNAGLFNAIAGEYPDLWTSSEATANSRGWENNRLPKDYGYGKLKGKWLHPELDDYIRHEFIHEVGDVERIIVKWVMNPFKATKTLGSIPTHARNFLGNLMFSIIMRNSILNPANTPYYYKALEIILKRNTTKRKEWADLIRNGVTETQFYGAEIPKFYNELMRLDPPEWPDKIAKWLFRKPLDFAGRAYNFEDVIYRVAADIKNREHFGFDPEKSVTEINRGMTNYRKLPLIVDIMRRWTMFGPFISFKANVAKIITSQITQGAKETAKKGTRIFGVKRLLRIAFALGVPWMVSKLSKELGNFDEEQLKRLEEAWPEYRRRGNFIWYRWKGKLKVLDLTYIWPSGDFERAIRAAIAGDTDSFLESLQVFAHPIFDFWQVMIKGREPYWDMPIPGTGNLWKDVYNRVASVVKNIWLPASIPVPSLKGLIKGEVRAGNLTPYQFKAILDAYWGNADAYGRVKVLPEEIKNFFTGLRTWNVEPEKLIRQSMRKYRSEVLESESQYKSWIRRHPGATTWERKDRKLDAQRYIKIRMDKIRELSQLYNELAAGGWGFREK